MLGPTLLAVARSWLACDPRIAMCWTRSAGQPRFIEVAFSRHASLLSGLSSGRFVQSGVGSNSVLSALSSVESMFCRVQVLSVLSAVRSKCCQVEALSGLSAVRSKCCEDLVSEGPQFLSCPFVLSS